MTEHKHHWREIAICTDAMQVPGGVIVRSWGSDDYAMVFVPGVLLHVAADGSVQIIAAGPAPKGPVEDHG